MSIFVKNFFNSIATVLHLFEFLNEKIYLKILSALKFLLKAGDSDQLSLNKSFHLQREREREGNKEKLGRSKFLHCDRHEETKESGQK